MYAGEQRMMRDGGVRLECVISNFVSMPSGRGTQLRVHMTLYAPRLSERRWCRGAHKNIQSRSGYDVINRSGLGPTGILQFHKRLRKICRCGRFGTVWDTSVNHSDGWTDVRTLHVHASLRGKKPRRSPRCTTLCTKRVNVVGRVATRSAEREKIHFKISCERMFLILTSKEALVKKSSLSIKMPYSTSPHARRF